MDCERLGRSAEQRCVPPETKVGGMSYDSPVNPGSLFFMGSFQLDLDRVARIKYTLHLRDRPVQQVAFHKAVKIVRNKFKEQLKCFEISLSIRSFKSYQI